MKAIKTLDRISILLVNLLLSLVCIMTSAICIASSPSFYKKQFEKTGIYATIDENGEEQRTSIYYIGGSSYESARFSNEQLDNIIRHIVDYLFTDQESFALTMDGVEVNGRIRDNVDIFGEVAISHMEEVKTLFRLVIVLTVILSILLIALIVYLVFRWKYLAPILIEYSVLFYGICLAVAGGFLLWSWISSLHSGLDFPTQLWRNLHYFFFPFQSDKFVGSFFDDTLTQILTLDFFLGAVKSVLLVLCIILSAWFGVAIFGKIYTKRIITKGNKE